MKGEIGYMVTKTCLDKSIVILGKIIDPLCGIIGAVIASVMLVGMMFLTFADVIGGQLGKLSFITDHTGLIKPIVGSQEMTELMMVVLVSFALGYCALHKGHIRVDLVLQFTSSRVTRWFDIFAYGISCLFYALIAWQSWLFAWDNISTGMVSSVLLIPIYPFNFLLVIGAAITVLIFFRDFLKSIQEVVR
jgi:TRAP-type C4-dicarboxylate transport system permease small subunit